MSLQNVEIKDSGQWEVHIDHTIAKCDGLESIAAAATIVGKLKKVTAIFLVNNTKKYPIPFYKNNLSSSRSAKF